MPDPEPLPAAKKRRVIIKPAIKTARDADDESTEEADMVGKTNHPLDVFLGYEAVEVAANALITSIIQQLEDEPDLGHTGAIRQAVQFLYNIGKKPNKIKNYKELHKLLDTLEQYHQTR